jgi:hypothetical protein
LPQVPGQGRVDAGRDEGFLAVGQGLFQRAPDVVVGDRNGLDLAVLQQGLELAVGNRLDRLPLDVQIAQQADRDKGQQDVPEVELGALLDVHACRL